MKSRLWLDRSGSADVEQPFLLPMYIFLLSHGIGIYLISLDRWLGFANTLGMISVVSAVVFFLMLCFSAPPLGVVVMTAITGLLSFAIPYFVGFLVRSVIESIVLIVLGGVVAFLSIGLVVTVVNSVIVSAVITPLITAPYLAGFGFLGLSALTGAGVGAGVNAGMRRFSAGGVRFFQVLINLVLMVVLVWPVFTWTGVFRGMFALKPVWCASQQFTSFSKQNLCEAYGRFFSSPGSGKYVLNDVTGFTFDEDFYDSYIYPGRNTFAQGATPAASNDTNIAFCMNGMIYLVDTVANETYNLTAYAAKREDAMVMTGQEAFLFAQDRILLLGPAGRYIWKDTSWTSDYEKLSRTEQYERLYAILEAQNDGQPGQIPIEDVAVVARAQRCGQLLSYDSDNHCAYFAEEGRRGKITVLRQSAPNTRTETISFTPNCSSENLPYTLMSNDTVAYIDGNSIVFHQVDGEWEYDHYIRNSFDGEKNPFVSFHAVHDTQNREYFMIYIARDDVLCVERLGDTVLEMPTNTGIYATAFPVGNAIYMVKYDSEDPINKFTYLNDRKEGETLLDVWGEAWNWSKIQLRRDIWENLDAQNAVQDGTTTQEESTVSQTQPPTEDLAEKYPAPKVNTSAKQIGLYKDNVTYPSRYFTYEGPVEGFCFRYPSILYQTVDYTYNADGSEVRLVFYCQKDPSMLTVSLRPNTVGTDLEAALSELQRKAQESMVNAKEVDSGTVDGGAAARFYLTGNAADDPGLTCTRLCRVEEAYIMEMELRFPNAVSLEDQAYKDYYAQTMYACCEFGANEEPPLWKKFKSKYE